MCACARDDAGQLVHFLAGVACAAGCGEAAYHAAGVCDCLEDAESGIANYSGQGRHLQAEAEVWLVSGEAFHCIGVCEARERLFDLDAREGALCDVDVEVLDEIEYVFLFDEAHFEVELGVLGLAIGPQIFVPETAGDLEVAVDSRDHE